MKLRAIYPFLAVLLVLPTAFAQNNDRLASVNVMIDGTSDGLNYILKTGGGTVLADEYSFPTYTTQSYSVLEPVKVSDVQYIEIDLPGSAPDWGSFDLTIKAPPGYTVYVDTDSDTLPDTELKSLSGSKTLGLAGSNRFYYQVVDNRSLGASVAGQMTRLDVADLVFELGLGSMDNGKSAGHLQLRHNGKTGASTYGLPSGVFTFGSLQFVGPRTSGLAWSSITNGRKLETDQVKVEVVNTNTNEVTVSFYAGNGSTGYSGTAFATYVLLKATSSLPTNAPSSSDCLKITETQGSVTVVHWVFRSTAGDTWTLIQGTSTDERIEEHASAIVSTNREETITVKNSGLTTVTKRRLTWAPLSNGEAMIKDEVWSNPAGSADLITEHEYYGTGVGVDKGDRGLLKKTTYPNGAEVEYDYYDDDGRLGQIETVTEPWSNGSTTYDKVTTYDYDAPTGLFKNYLKSEEVTINSVTVAKTTHSYSFGTTDYTRTTQSYYSSGNSLTTVTKAYRKDAPYFYAGRAIKVEHPDGRQQSMLYEEGTYSGGTFTVGTGDASRTWIVEGSHTGGSATTSINGLTFESIGLVTNQSTLTEIVRNQDDNVVSEKTYVWNGSTWDTSYPIVNTSTAWFDGVRQQNRTEVNGAYQEWTWNGAYPASTKDAAGVEMTYAYDSVGRTSSITRTSLGSYDSYQSHAALTTSFGYDAANRRTSSEESDGSNSRTTSYSYDGAGRPTAVSLPDGRSGSTSYSFPGSGLSQVSETLPGGATRVTQTLIDGKLKQVTGTAGVETYHSYTLNGGGTITTRTDVASGSSSRWQSTTTDWLGRATETRRPGFTGQSDMVTTPTYDSTTGLVTKVSRTGLADEYHVYDDMARLTRTGMDLGGSGLSPSDGSDRVTDYETVFNKVGSDWWVRTTETIYPSTSSPTSTLVTGKSWVRLTGLGGGTLAETAQEDTFGNVATAVTTVDRTKRRVTTTTTYPGVSNTAVSISNNGYPVKMTGTDGRSVTQVYDGLGRLYQQVDSRTGTTTYAYKTHSGNATDQLDTITAPIGGTTGVVATYTYDSAGRIASVKNINNDYAYYSYDNAGRRTRQWGGAVTPVENVYNSYGEMTEQRTFRGGTWTGSTWPGGTADATTYTYDAPSGLLTRVQDAATNHTDYTYNDRGLVATRELARLNASSQRIKTTYSYASNSTELTGKTYNDNTPNVSFTYNRIGQMLTAVDVHNGTTTQTRTFEYNGYQQLAVEKLPSYLGSRWITYTFEDGTGGTLEGRGSGYELGVSGTPAQDMKSLLGYSGTTGLVTSLTATHAGVAARAFAYSYASNTSLLTGIAQSTIGYTQTRAYETDRDLLKEITTKFSTTTKTRFDYTFNSLGQKVSAKQYGQSGSAFADMGNDSFYRYTYNSRGELTLAAGYLGTDVSTYNSGNALPGRYFELGYDQAGNRTSHNATGVSGVQADYTINSLNQITGRENHYVPVSGTVDSAAKVVVDGELAGQQGNYWSGEAVLDNTSGPAYATDISVKAAKPSPETKQISGLLSAFIEPAAETLSYDLDGNLSSDGRWTYAYDAENRLVQMETNSTAMAVGLPGKRYVFRYDSLGRRTAKESWSWSGSSWSLTQDLRFVYQSWNLVAELDGSGTRQRTHAWGLDIAGTIGATGGIGALVQTVDHTGTVTAYLPGYDGSGNLTALMMSDGTIAAAYEYSPFGSALRTEGTYADKNPFRFSTKYTDETGLVYYGHRYYSPSLGRFINRDPIGANGGVNLYAFAGNDAANGGDYLGLDAFMDPVGLADGTVWWREGDFEMKVWEDPNKLVEWAFPDGVGGWISFHLHRDYFASLPRQMGLVQGDPTKPWSIASELYSSAMRQKKEDDRRIELARQDPVLLKFISEIVSNRSPNRPDTERERELREKYKKYIDYVNEPDNPLIVFDSIEEANIAGALLAAVKGGAYMEKKFKVSLGKHHGERNSYASEEYIWGIVSVDGGFRPTRAITNGKYDSVDPYDNPAIKAAFIAGILVGLGHNHPPGGRYPEIMSGYGDHGSQRGDRNVADYYGVPFFMTSPSGTHYRGTAFQRPVKVTVGPNGGEFNDLIRILKL